MSQLKLKVITVVGTRPEIIRLSRIISLLDETVNHILVHTGQNYDYELNEIFFKDLELKPPDYYLNINTSSLGTAVGDIIKKSEEIFLKEKPDALLVLGDTNSCLSAYMAKRLHITVFHMEAGNRCFDENVPEEINRRIIDHISDFNLVYTEHARRNLLSEGIHPRRIYLTGSPMAEVIDYYKPKIDSSNIIEKLDLKPKEYFLVSFHREENIEYEQNLMKILNLLKTLIKNYNWPIIISTHPRTRKKLENLKNENFPPNIIFSKPFGFIDYIKLQLEAFCTISDSGTISEESAILNFPAICIRNSMERPEALDSGTIILTGLDEKIILNSIEILTKEYYSRKFRKIPEEYTIKDVSWRVLKIIAGNTHLNKIWHNYYDK